MPANERKDDGGPAFPGDGGSIFCGMSLREWFAGQALAGMAKVYYHDDDPGVNTEHIAVTAYEIADAMLAERAK